MLCETESHAYLKWTANKKASINPIYNFLVYASWPFESNRKKTLKTTVFSLNSMLKLSMDKLIWKHSQSYKSSFPFTLQVILKLLPKFYSFYSNERGAKKNTSGMSIACSLYGYRYSTQSDPNTSTFLYTAMHWSHSQSCFVPLFGYLVYVSDWQLANLSAHINRRSTPLLASLGG